MQLLNTIISLNLQWLDFIFPYLLLSTCIIHIIIHLNA
jgi:hypothetical protein